MPENKVQLIIEAIDKSKEALQQIRENFNKVEESGKKTSGFFATFKDNWLAITAAAYAAKKVIDELMENMQEAAYALQTEAAFENVARSAGQSAEEIVSRMDEAAAGTISSYDRMRKALKGMTQDLDGDQIVKLTEAARVGARAASIDVASAFETINDAVANNLPKSLRQMGLLTKQQMGLVNAAVREGIDEINLYDLVIANATVKQAQMGTMTVTAAERFQQFKAEVKEVKEAIGTGLLWVLEKVWGVLQGNAAVILIFAAGIQKLAQGIAYVQSIIRTADSEKFRKEAQDAKQEAERLMKEASDLAGKARANIFGGDRKESGSNQAEIDAARKKQEELEKELQRKIDAAKNKAKLAKAAAEKEAAEAEVGSRIAALEAEEGNSKILVEKEIARFKKKGVDKAELAKLEQLELTKIAKEEQLNREKLEENFTKIGSDELAKRLAAAKDFEREQTELLKKSGLKGESKDDKLAQIKQAAAEMQGDIYHKYQMEEVEDAKKYERSMTEATATELQKRLLSVQDFVDSELETLDKTKSSIEVQEAEKTKIYAAAEKKRAEILEQYRMEQAEKEAQYQLSRLDFAEAGRTIDPAVALQQRITLTQGLLAEQQKYFDTLDREKNTQAWYAQRDAIAGTEKQLLDLEEKERERTGTFADGMRAQLYDAQKAFYGIYSAGKDAWKGIGDSFEGLFKDAITNKLKTFQDYWTAFWDMMGGIAAKLLRNQLEKAIMNLWDQIQSQSSGGGFGSLLSGLGSMIGGFFGGSGAAVPIIPGAGPTIIVHQGGYIPKFHFGGLAHDEIPAILQRGEYVVSRKGVDALDRINSGNISGGMGGITINNYITAVDTQSFRDAIQRDPGCVTTVVINDTRAGGAMRTAIKGAMA